MMFDLLNTDLYRACFVFVSSAQRARAWHALAQPEPGFALADFCIDTDRNGNESAACATGHRACLWRRLKGPF